MDFRISDNKSIMMQATLHIERTNHSLITSATRRLVLDGIDLANMGTLLLDELHEGARGERLLLHYLISRILLRMEAGRRGKFRSRGDERRGQGQRQ